ncbi:MAG: agmatine deiminase family protein [Bacteroidetes bacterium]|nr:agmatine deiminase family protein [Bacteroidota bacterium]
MTITKIFLTLIIALITITAKAQVAITIPAEYEKNDKLILVWPYLSGVDSIIGEITGIAKQVVNVEIIYNPDSTQFDTTQIRSFLSNMGINNENVSFIPAFSNTYWLRQYSPITGYGVFIDSLVQYLGNPGFSSYNRPADDSIPVQLANFWNMDFAEYNLEFESTNVQYDGLRNLFVGDHIIEQNIPMDEVEISFALNSYYSTGEVIFIPSLDQSGGGNFHSIDMYMKLLDSETILVASIPDTLPDYAAIEDIVFELSSISSYYGSNYKIIRILSPPNDNGNYPIIPEDEMRTYTNSLILNNTVIVPSYGLPEFDFAAYNIYEKYMPGYNIYMVDARLLTPNYGSIHTITKEIPQSNFLRILHEKVTGPQEFISDFHINCLVASGNQVEEMWLYYKLNNDTSYTKTTIHLVCPQHFGTIAGLQTTDTVHYYIEAISSSTTTTYPLSAPEGNFTFWFDIVNIDETYVNTYDFELVPNPSNGKFAIIRQNENSEIRIKIFNSVGQLVFVTQAYTGEIINTGNKLDKGYYTVIVGHNNNISKLKMVILN